jgi:hypothetical protein
LAVVCRSIEKITQLLCRRIRILHLWVRLLLMDRQMFYSATLIR